MQQYFDALIRHADKYNPLSPEEQTRLPLYFTYRKLKRKELLIKEGEVANFTYFVIKGCLRSYRIDPHGVERINFFAIEDWWISDLHSFLTRQPATSFVEALEDTHILQQTRDEQLRMFDEIPKFERIFRILHENYSVAMQNRILETNSIPAEQRYENFSRKYPQFEQRIPLKYIASYLGITPEFLSMIRSKKAKRRHQ